MSQIVHYFTNNGPGGYIQTITGNSGPALVPTAGNINIFGGTNVTTTGTAPSTLTITLSGAIPDSFVTNSGTAVPIAGVLDIVGGHNISTSGAGNTVTINVSGTTNHDVQIGNATGSLSSVTNGTTGQVLTATTGADPSWQNLPSSNITITGDSGGPLTGTSFTFTGGSTGLTFAGAGSTETLGGTLKIANGGTNATSMTNTDGVVYYDGTRLVTTAVGTATNILTSNGAGMAPTFQAAPSGGITTINGDSGSVTGSTVTISGGTTGLTTSGSGTTMDLTGTLIVGNGGTGVATMTTAYAPVCAGTTATGNLQVASTGLSTSGYVLTSNGASALPSFKAAPGSLVQVGTTQTANNSASISFTSAISASYNTYLLNFSNVYPASNNEPLQMVISTNNGSSYITSSYQAGLVNWSYNQSPGLGGNANSTSAVLLNNGVTNSQSDAASGQLWLSNTGNGGSFYCWGNATGTAGGTALIIQIAGTNNVTGVNAIQLAMGSGNITAGTFSLYGLVGS